MHDELVKLMAGEVSELVFSKSGPTVILLAGLQGVGKTTVCAKLANYLKKLVHHHSPFHLLSFIYLVCLQVVSNGLSHIESSHLDCNHRGRAACWLREMCIGLLLLTN